MGEGVEEGSEAWPDQAQACPANSELHGLSHTHVQAISLPAATASGCAPVASLVHQKQGGRDGASSVMRVAEGRAGWGWRQGMWGWMGLRGDESNKVTPLPYQGGVGSSGAPFSSAAPGAVQASLTPRAAAAFFPESPGHSHQQLGGGLEELDCEGERGQEGSRGPGMGPDALGEGVETPATTFQSHGKHHDLVLGFDLRLTVEV